MHRTSLWALALLSAVPILAAARDAHALGPIDVEVAAKAGGGTNPTGQQPNPLGFGLGGRGGVSFLGIYGGVNFVYYFGGSVPVPGAGNQTLSSYTVGAELGYGIKLFRFLTIRPQLGIGKYVYHGCFPGSASGGGSAGCDTESNLYVESGVTALVSFGHLFVGADLNVLVLPSAGTNSDGSSFTDAAFTAHGQVGVRF